VQQEIAHTFPSGPTLEYGPEPAGATHAVAGMVPLCFDSNATSAERGGCSTCWVEG
jgi:hypothetical protein